MPPTPPKERLLSALKAVPAPPPLPDLLPREALATLDQRLTQLSPEQRQELLSGSLATAMPLLHLRAGGNSLGALLALAASPAATQELPPLFELAPNATNAERSAVVRLLHDLAKRAAEQALRDLALDLAHADKDLPAVLSSVVGAAQSAERPELIRLAFETWAEANASDLPLAELAASCALLGDEACFSAARARVSPKSPLQARLERLSQSLTALRGKDPVNKAWGLLQLERYGEARASLVPVAARAKSDLRVAAAMAVATADGSACPGLQSGIGSAALCAGAFQSREGLAPALADMQIAWQSGGGRTPEANEAYVGLAQVVPWVNALALATDAQVLERDFSERYQKLSRVLAELPEQKGFAVFASAFEAGVTAGLRSHGGRPTIDSNRKQELWFGAIGVEGAAPRLAVGAVLAADQPVLQLIPTDAPGPLWPARAGLLSWEAVSAAEPATLENAKSALAMVQQAAPPASTAAASAVLLMAELEAATQPSERAYSALAAIGGQLIGEGLPPELALRSLLDTAGALERLGRTQDALGVLRKGAEIGALPGPAGELLLLIRAEKLMLEWDAKKDPKREALAKALGELQVGAAPASFSYALAAWGGPKLMKAGKWRTRADLDERAGKRAAELLVKGVLRTTQVSLRVTWAFQTGLMPEVTFDPMFVPLVRPDLIQKAL